MNLTYLTKKKSTSTLLLALLCAIFVGAGASAQETQADISDADITFATKNELQQDPVVAGKFINVSTTNGVVELTGSATSMREKKRATLLAKSIRGVLSVVNRISAKAPERSDEQINIDVQEALAFDPATDNYDIDVSVSDGIVTLSGTVQSYPEMKLAEKLAMGVPGVRDIENNISMHYSEERADAAIADDVKRRIAYDARVDDEMIEVDVENGNVFLSGAVGSAAERSLASADAWVIGVNSVDVTNIEVRWWARNDMKKIEVYKDLTDAKIRDAILEALVIDPRIFMDEITVLVNDGFVTLRGKVNDLRAKKVAEQDALNTVGVWGVDNNLTVSPDTQLSDNEIVSRIESAVQKEPYADMEAIEVSSNDGIVRLSGEIASVYESELIEKIAWRTKGVVDVSNELSTSMAQINKQDKEILAGIESELIWSPHLDLENINVRVVDGKATIEGTVDSYHKKLLAEKNAYQGGARIVENKIEVSR